MRWLRDFRITGSESEQGSLLQALGNFTHSVLDRGVAVEEISEKGATVIRFIEKPTP